MCGIGVTWGIDNVEALQRVVRAMAHRGPDDEGVFFDGSVGLGNRRLSIVDLSPSGRQPIANEDGSVEVVFNGEIYNHKDLRWRLLAKGHRFIGSSDTEVIVHLYEESGPECLRDLRGMFGLAIYDRAKGTLLVARDPLGIKPLYWARVGKGFIFASELQALLASGLLPRHVSRESLAHYLSFGSVPAPLTIWDGVFSLMPAERMIIKAEAATRDIYWELGTQERPRAWDEAEATSEVRSLLEESVSRQMLADVPVGVFLSGGFDSTLLTALASRCTNRPLRTFSVGFPDARPSMDERPYARLVAQTYATEHTEVPVTAADVIEAVPHFAEHLDQPSVDAMNTYLVSLAAGGRVKAVISGLGGDELFGGYSTLKFSALLSRLSPVCSHTPRPLARVAGRVEQCSPIMLRLSWPWRVGMGALYGSSDSAQHYALVRFLFSDREKRALLSEDFLPQPAPPPSLEVLSSRRVPPCDTAAARVAFLDLSFYMTDTLLRDTDVMSMSRSLEVRVPYLDQALVEAVVSMPSSIRWGRTWEPKHLLRQAFGSEMPAEVMARRKMGFGLPMEDWLRTKGMSDLVQDCLSPESLASRGLLRSEAVGRVVDDFYRTRRLHRNVGHLWQRLWLLVALELWLRSHVDKFAATELSRSGVA